MDKQAPSDLRPDPAAGGGESGERSPVPAMKILYIAVAVATAAVFANALAGGFVWVDHVEIFQESYVIDSWNDFRAAWTGPVTDMGREGGQADASSGYYRPVQLLFITLNHALFGKNATLHHIPNIVLHILSTLLLMGTVARLTRSRFIAGLTGFLYGVHPIHVESVTWISGNKDTLSGFLFFAALCLYVRWRESARGGAWRLPLAIASFGLAMLTKEAVIVLPAVILLMEIVYGRGTGRDIGREPGRSRGARAAGVVWFGVAAAGYLVLRAAVLGTLKDKTDWHGGGQLETFLTMPGVLAEYVGKLLLPLELTTADTTRIVTSPLQPAFLAGAAIVVFVLGYTIWFWRIASRSAGAAESSGGGDGVRDCAAAMAFGMAVFWIALLPVLNLFPIHHIKAERFLYLPSAGFLVAVAATFAVAGEKLRARGVRATGRIVTAAAAVYVVFLGLSTVDRNRDWRDDHTLFTNDVLGTPNYREGLTWLGRTYLDKGKPYLAAQSLEMAAIEDPDFTSYVNYRGLLDASGRALMAMERYDEAAAAFRALVEIDPEEPLAHMNLGTALAGAGRLEEAMLSYAAAERLDPRNALVYFNRGFALFKVGDRAAARADLERAIELDPRNTNALNLLGVVLLDQGEAARAASLWRRSIEIKPGQERIMELLKQAEAEPQTPDNR